MQDESCHWYCIPADKKCLFNRWIQAMENDDDYSGESFDEYRLNMHVSNYCFKNVQAM